MCEDGLALSMARRRRRVKGAQAADAVPTGEAHLGGYSCLPSPTPHQLDPCLC